MASIRKDPPKVYFWLYTAIAALMVGSGAVMLALQSHFDHMVFVLEATEITLFAAFWLVQTKELWDDTIRPPTDEPPTTPTPPATAPVEAAAQLP